MEKEVQEIAKKLGSRGGTATKNKLGKEHYKKIGALGGKKNKGKKRK